MRHPKGYAARGGRKLDWAALAGGREGRVRIRGAVRISGWSHPTISRDLSGRQLSPLWALHVPLHGPRILRLTGWREFFKFPPQGTGVSLEIRACNGFWHCHKENDTFLKKPLTSAGCLAI
jgi:hypothetical protein